MKAIASLFRGWLGGRRSGAGAARGNRIYVLDGPAVLGYRGDRGSTPPRETVAGIQRLARFAQRERIKLQAVFMGEPPRKAPDGADFGGIEVFYANTPSERVETIARLAEQAGRRNAVTIVSADAVVEQRALSLGCEVMRAATFRKGLELSFSGATEERAGTEDAGPGPDRGGDRDRRRDPPRRRRGGRGGRVWEDRSRDGRGNEPRPPDARGPAPEGAPDAGGGAAARDGAPNPGRERPSETPPPAAAAPTPAPAPATVPPPKSVSDDIRKLIDLVE